MFVHWKMAGKTFVSLKKDLKYFMCLKCKIYKKFYFNYNYYPFLFFII